MVAEQSHVDYEFKSVRSQQVLEFSREPMLKGFADVSH